MCIKSIKTSICVIFFLFLVDPGSAANLQSDKSEPIELTVVREKIEALGLRDDTLKNQERPLVWLRQRREQIMPELIAGLDNKEKRIATGCLEVLEGITENESYLDSLLRIARDKNHLICAETTLSLCAFVRDERAKSILEKALMDTELLSDLQNRATIAQALGRKADAVRLLVPLLDSLKEDYELMKIIKLLGDIGHSSAIESLEKFSLDSRWRLAVESYLGMANIDPDKYGLTKDQETFLKESLRGFKANRDVYIEHWKKLAGLNKNEIRPFVMQMMKSDSPEAALIILQLWNDKESLPDIKRLLKKERIKGREWAKPRYVAAYLNIEGTDVSITEVISMTAEYRRRNSLENSSHQSRTFDNFNARVAAMAVNQSIMSDERKLYIFKRFRDEFGSDFVARNIPFFDGKIAEFMNDETDISVIGWYVRTFVRNDKQRRFSREISAALEKLIAKDAMSSNEVSGAQSILDACVAYNLSDSAKMVEKFLSPDSNVVIRMSAARMVAKLGGDRSKALQILYQELDNSNLGVRIKASNYIRTLECLDEPERAERENIILSHLGKQSEDYALRILTTCSGDKTAEQLLPVFDEQDVPRAIYAAWILAQHPDESVKQKAIRYLAIYALFYHQTYQAGSGIDFTIAPDLSFHQTLTSFNRTDYKQSSNPVTIPRELLVPFGLNEREQAFAIRAYRYSQYKNRHDIFPPFHFQLGRDISWDASHLPLFRVIAYEDPHLSVLFVKGQKVAHFKNRKAAAQIIAGITNEKASYTGLAGEEIDSQDVPPQPYKNQDQLIARFIMDQIESLKIQGRPQTDAEWRDRDIFDSMLRNLTSLDSYNSFGVSLKNELIAESRRRNIAVELKKAGFSLWRDITE